MVRLSCASLSSVGDGLTLSFRSIVNGLRDDDGESFYGDRASFYSEYSVKDDSNVKLFFKEHERKSSKGSVNSFLSRKKSQQQSKGSARPETKVCLSLPSSRRVFWS